MIRSVSIKAANAGPGLMARELSKHKGWVSGMVPLPERDVNMGTELFSINETRSVSAPACQMPVPAITTGFSLLRIISMVCFAPWRSTGFDVTVV